MTALSCVVRRSRIEGRLFAESPPLVRCENSNTLGPNQTDEEVPIGYPVYRGLREVRENLLVHEEIDVLHLDVPMRQMSSISA